MSEAAKQMIRVEDTKSGRFVSTWKYLVVWVGVTAGVAVSNAAGDNWIWYLAGFLLAWIPFYFLFIGYRKRFIL